MELAIIVASASVIVLGSIYAWYPRPRKQYRQRSVSPASETMVRQDTVSPARLASMAPVQPQLPDSFVATLVTAFEGCNSPMRLATIARRARRLDRSVRNVPLDAFAKRLDSFRRNGIVRVRQGVNGTLFVGREL